MKNILKTIACLLVCVCVLSACGNGTKVYKFDGGRMNIPKGFDSVDPSGLDCNPSRMGAEDYSFSDTQSLAAFTSESGTLCLSKNNKLLDIAKEIYGKELSLEDITGYYQANSRLGIPSAKDISDVSVNDRFGTFSYYIADSRGNNKEIVYLAVYISDAVYFLSYQAPADEAENAVLVFTKIAESVKFK